MNDSPKTSAPRVNPEILGVYIDLAKQKHRFKSDRQLSLALGLSTSTVNQWIAGRSFPNDGVMIRLATMAGENPDLALINLNVWRSNDESVKNSYRRIADIVHQNLP